MVSTERRYTENITIDSLITNFGEGVISRNGPVFVLFEKIVELLLKNPLELEMTFILSQIEKLWR